MTYEYTCLACHHEWEAEQSISERPLTECPSCHEPQAKRMVSGGAGFILKGGGWYADGYGSAAKNATAKDDGGNGSGSDAKKTKKDKETKKASEASSSESNSTETKSPNKNAST